MQIIKSTLILATLLGLQSIAQASEEVRPPVAFEQLKGKYKLIEAKGRRKEFCPTSLDVVFSKVEIDRQIFSMVNVTPRLLLPLANYSKRFSESGRCQSTDTVKLYELTEQNSLVINETITEACQKKRKSNKTIRVLEYDSSSNQLSFLSKENGRSEIRCVWLKSDSSSNK